MFQEDGSSSITSSPLQFFSMMSLSPTFGSPYPWLRELKSEERGLYLIHLLLACANHVASGSLENANISLEQISHLASPVGDTMQRIAAHFTEALGDRILKSLPGVYKARYLTQTSVVSEEIVVRKLFFEMFPFHKVAFLLTNQAIMEAMEGEKMVHIIDLHATEPAQWVALLQALSSRPHGPPHLRLTGVHQQKEVLDHMARRLTEEAEKLDIPFQFNSIVCKLENLVIENLRVKTGEALAISSVLQLHTLLAPDDEPQRRSLSGAQFYRNMQASNGLTGELIDKEMVNGCSPCSDSASSSPLSQPTSMKIDSFLSALSALTPKVMVVTEQDCNHNGSTLMERLLEALHSYAAIFDCLEFTMGRTPYERLKVEKMIFGEEIKNIIACEGTERRERHEKIEKWIHRLESVGFGNVNLSNHGILLAKRLLLGYGCNGYRIREEGGCVIICWHDQPLFSVSAWRDRR